ncbi:MAG: hypothetical protein ABJH28_00600 [Paraglaciecola sp.]|uniref:hypothetical protein n=1 Tax=Paraglaciecola sp. TaxID=1920173 RepID=UPI003266B364
MDFNKNKLKELMGRADDAFEAYKNDTASKEYAKDYETAKKELDLYLFEVRSFLSPSNKTR